MRIGSKLATAVLATGLAVAGFAGPAQAATTDDTTTTFTITAGALAVTAPATAALGTVATGAGTTSGQLGGVTIDDTRGALINSWTTTVSSSAFVLPGATPTANETVAVDQIAYSSGAFTAQSGLGTFVPGLLANGGVPGTAASYTGAAGNSSTTWNPTLTLTLLSSQVAGTYTGTVTHSVA